CEPRRRVPTQPIGPSKETLPLRLVNRTTCGRRARSREAAATARRRAIRGREEKKNGSGGIRTHASEETGALNQRLRPLGHATINERSICFSAVLT
ncbi:hypothetical protein ALC56_05814, partial [Trachymyrmex septentrionalis]